MSAARKNPPLSTYAGGNDAGGKRRPVKAVLAHRSVVADLKVRFRYIAQTDFVKEAAAKCDPPESISLFIATAALERASAVLDRPSPDPAGDPPE